MRRSLESRVLALGLTLLSATTAFFIAFKLAMWRSVVVHEEETSIHRLFFDTWTVRFPQEPFNLVDFLTTTFLVLAGTFALLIAFWMGERIRRAIAGPDAPTVRRFFRLAGVGLVWLGLDEIFLIHEFASANLYVHDALFLAGYAAVALVAFVAWWRVIFSNKLALAVLAAGAAIHGASLVMDFLQELFSWFPEEPAEMVAAGLYALSMSLYAARLLPGPAVQPLPDAAVQPLPDAAVEPLEPKRPSVGRDPAWIH